MESENKLTPKDKQQLYYVGISIISIFLLTMVAQIIIDYNQDGFISMEDAEGINISNLIEQYVEETPPQVYSAKSIHYSDGSYKTVIEEVNE